MGVNAEGSQDVSQQPASAGVPSPIQLRPIGHVVTGYSRPAETPPQSTENFAEPGRVVLHEEYRRGMVGVEECSYIWLVTWLHAHGEEEAASLRVVPRGSLTGQERGVFATRAPTRPNRVGMSLVRVVNVEGRVIHFEGVDLVNGTPVLDIKPWVSGTDIPPERATSRWSPA